MKGPETSTQRKQLVKDKYAEIAEQSKHENATSCCGASCCGDTLDTALMADDYSHLNGYVADADLGLGCGLPTEFAHIKPGDVVIDLGSGAGNDAFVARSLTGETGQVIGVDFTPAMVEKARANVAKLGLDNVTFTLGDIENLPLETDSADVVVSNCVLNLVPDKAKAFAETFRVLKPGGHFSVSDIVLVGTLPEGLQHRAEMYVGCIAGALQKDEYLDLIHTSGFKNIQLQKEKKITIPDEILSVYLEEQALEAYKASTLGIYSITVSGEKPIVAEKEPCCSPGCCH